MSLFENHKPTIDQAIEAIHARTFFSQYPEHPSPNVYGENADATGRKKFQTWLGNKFDDLQQTGGEKWISTEESPFTQEPLKISYPATKVDKLISNAKKAKLEWAKASPEVRAGVLVESLEKMKSRFFEIAYATMHTTGQGYMMAFQASGPHAADRALEAVAMGYEELKRFPESVLWDKPMGKYNIALNKEWRAVPKGIALAVGCSTFPTWNTVPGMYASLITGNPVIVKPHPGAVLPIAIVIAGIQEVLVAEGFDPNICQLAPDTQEALITKELAEHPEVKIIDFTGNAGFGSYLEGLQNKAVFTEKTGVNSMILDSAEDIDKVAGNIAFSIALYSGQMCTAPQNIFVPEAGIKTPSGVVSFEEFTEKLSGQITGLADNPKAGPFVLGAVQNKNTLNRVKEAHKLKGEIVLESRSIPNPMFENARMATPVLLAVEANQQTLFSQELFGPIALLIKTKDTNQSLTLAAGLARAHGAISCGAYTIDSKVKEQIKDAMAMAFTPVSFNLTGGIYVNQNASFSDFHVTGGNPSGNASFTNPEFVIKRFVWVGFREPK